MNLELTLFMPAGASPACADDPDLFYDNRRAEHARAVCAECPYRVECLETAMYGELNYEYRRYRYGIFGGLTGEEREALQRERDGGYFGRCAECGDKFPLGTGRSYRYCTPECLERAKYKREVAAEAA